MIAFSFEKGYRNGPSQPRDVEIESVASEEVLDHFALSKFPFKFADKIEVEGARIQSRIQC